MSLIRAALRISIVQALKGRTLFGDNVRDSSIGAIDIADDGTIRTVEDGPFIAVYTHEGDVDTDLQARALTPQGTTEIVLEWGISAAMTEPNRDIGESTIVGIGLPDTDASFEFSLDMVGADIIAALTDPDNEWAERYRRLVFRHIKIKRTRAASGEGRTRLAGHQMIIWADLVDEPIIGDPLAGDIDDLLTAMEALEDDTLKSQAVMMRARLAAEPAPEWHQIQRRLGLTAPELAAMGRGPLPQDEDRSTPEFASATINIDGRDPQEVSS